MIRIPNPAEDVKHNPTAQSKIVAPAKSASRGAADRGDKGVKKDEWCLFNPEIAAKVDIVFATVCYGMYLWIRTPAKGNFKKPTIDGNLAAFQSARQFEEEYPWWDHNTIWRAIGRGEKKLKGQLVIDRTRKPMHFAMGRKLLTMHKNKNGFLGFLKSDAKKYGAWPAVCLSNLRHQVAEFQKSMENGGSPLLDDDGNIYGQLSPTKLTEVRADNKGDELPILPISYDRAVDAIGVLKKARAIISHPTRTGWYRIPKEDEIVNLEQKRSVGKRDITVGKRDKSVGKRDSKSVVVQCKTKEDSVLCANSESLDSNIGSNADRKCLLQETSPLRSHVSCEESSLSSGGKMLLKLINEDLARQKDKPVHSSNKLSDFAVYEVLDEDKVRLIGYDFYYDFLPIEMSTGKPYSRKQEIDDAIKQLKRDFQNKAWRYTLEEVERVRQLFLADASLKYDHVAALVHFSSPQTNPMIWENKKLIGKGHDDWYFARRIRSLKPFLKYLPELVREYYMEHISEQVFFRHGEDGKPICDYHKMPSPYLELAFTREEPEWDDQSFRVSTTYRRDGDCIITTYGHCGEVITEKEFIEPWYYQEAA